MAASVNQQFIEQLKEVGAKLLLPPSSTPELLNLLDEQVLLLSKIGQAPSQLIQEALLSTMKALISDKLMRNSDADVMITVAACLNDILRISAPVAPYDDEKMKEIFELIVSSFDKLSCPPGRCYSKAVLILESVARLRSCVMMLDLDCDSLITKMFELFQKHISSNHPHAVFLSMEKIMSVMIQESDNVPEDLLKVLLESVRKENQNASPLSFDLGAKVVEACSDKLKPYILELVTSMGCCLDDYAPILSSIYENAVKDFVHDSPKHQVDSEPTADELQKVDYAQPSKTMERCSQNPVTDLEVAAKRGGKLNSHNPDEGYESLTGKGKPSRGSPHAHMTKSSAAPRSDKMDNETSKKAEEAADLIETKAHQATPLGGISNKKGKPRKKDVSVGSGKKSTPGLSRKDKTQTKKDALRSQRKMASDDDDDDVFETPHGRKNYKEDLIGSRIKVWWPLDRRYYEGIITEFEASTKKHKVDYDDGDEEILNLREEQWEFVGDETSHIDLFVKKKKPSPSPNVLKREASTVVEKGNFQTNTNKKEVKPDCGEDGVEGLSDAKRPRFSNE